MRFRSKVVWQFERWISGRESIPSPLRLVFHAVSLGWEGIARCRLQWYKTRATAVKVPVVCVGNCSVGGNGKTPLVLWLARELVSSKYHPAILSRGYGDDEQHQFVAELEVPVAVGGNRLETAEKVTREYPEVDVLLMDDGMQHFKLTRNCNILMVNAINGCEGAFSNMLPLGSLREPWSLALKRSTAVVLHNSNLVEESVLDKLEASLREKAGGCDLQFFRSGFIPTSLVGNAPKKSGPINVVGLCGIGCPKAFEMSLRWFFGESVASVVVLEYPDHYVFEIDDIEGIKSQYSHKENVMFVTTEKDMYRDKKKVLSFCHVLRCKYYVDRKEDFISVVVGCFS